MNVETGMLRRIFGESEEQREEFLEAVKKEFGGAFELVPDELTEEAERELNGKDSTMVDMIKDTPLVNWAKERRQLHREDGTLRIVGSKAKKKGRTRMAKASRKRNREE